MLYIAFVYHIIGRGYTMLRVMPSRFVGLNKQRFTDVLLCYARRRERRD